MTRILAVVCALGLLAPEGLRGQASVSLQAGASLATVGGDVPSVVSTGTRTGLKMGVSAAVPISDNIGLELGASYAVKGSAMNVLGVNLDLALGYVEIPLLLRLAPSVDGPLSPHFMIGPALAFRVGCDIAATAEGVSISSDCDDDESFEGLKAMDFGAVAGAGLDIRATGSLSVSLDVFYNLGLLSIDSVDDLKTRAFSLLAGITFPIG